MYSEVMRFPNKDTVYRVCSGVLDIGVSPQDIINCFCSYSWKQVLSRSINLNQTTSQTDTDRLFWEGKALHSHLNLNTYVFNVMRCSLAALKPDCVNQLCWFPSLKILHFTATLCWSRDQLTCVQWGIHCKCLPNNIKQDFQMLNSNWVHLKTMRF